MKTVGRILLLLVAAWLGWLAWQYFFPNEQERVRKTLSSLAQTVSLPEKSTPVTLMLACNRLQDIFAQDVVVEINVAGAGGHTFSDRAEVLQALQGAWVRTHGVKVDFLDIIPVVDAAGQSATADLTAKITVPGERDLIVQELKFFLKKQDRTWRVTRVETEKTLK